MIAKLFLSFMIAFSFLALPFLFAQQRVLLRINKDGQQEAIPIGKGECAEDVLSPLDKMAPDTRASGPRDSLSNFGPHWGINFIASHQDVMFQWFNPEASGLVLEFGWKNGEDVGTIPKSTIRAWQGDKRLTSLPTNAFCSSGTGSLGNMGYYKKSDDGDGLKTPFKDEATDTNFVGGKGDSLTTRFDPLGKEAKWLIGGRQFSLVPDAWQSFKLLDFGDSLSFSAHQPFGFTKQNDTKISDIGGAVGDTNMLIGANPADQYPYHSIKFYEGTPTSNYGWQIRDYEWHMYVIVAYTTCRPPKITYTQLRTTVKTTPRKVSATIYGYDCDGLTEISSVDLFHKMNSGAYIQSPMTGTAPNYAGTIPGANPGDTVTYYITANFSNNSTLGTVKTTYSIFKPTKNVLYLWNGRSLPAGVTSAMTMAQYGMMNDSMAWKQWYDVWDVKTYGTDDIPDLLLWYNGVVEATGDGGTANLTGYAAAWLSTGTPQNPKAYFLSDQDHGFFTSGGYLDTSFAETDPHNKYFGLLHIINQDYPYNLSGNSIVTTPWKINVDSSASANPIFSSINRYQKDNGVTLWYHPNYEWPPFLNWMDELLPKPEAKVVFRDPKYNKVIGVRKSAPDNSWHTTFLAFDYLGCDFRSDTSTTIYATPDKDPKYKKLINVGNLAVNFIKTLTAVPVTDEHVPVEFSLSQNYPNPFNPATVIRYQLAVNSFVTMSLYDLLGRKVATLVNAQKPAGSYTVQWDATHFASGIYFYRLQAGNFSDTKKLLLLK